MHREGEEIHVDAQEASGGRKGSFLLKILLFSLALIVLLYGVTLLIGTGTAPYVPETAATDVGQ
jgi:hypothetical protein